LFVWFGRLLSSAATSTSSAMEFIAAGRPYHSHRSKSSDKTSEEEVQQFFCGTESKRVSTDLASAASTSASSAFRAL